MHSRAGGRPGARTEGEGLDKAARCALLAVVGASRVLLNSCVGGAGVDEGQARVNRFVLAPPAAIRSRMRCFSKATADLLFVVETSLRLR
jgi:hypothetical protein